MKNRVIELFQVKGKDILSIYFTAGFPSLTDAILIAQYLEKAGVDIIEIGIPFSDPIADGPTIQASNKTALDNGMNLHLLLEQVKEIRKNISLPIILMGYLNPVLQYGFETFVRDAAQAGVDGLILPDLPVDEYLESYKSIIDKSGMAITFLISPTTSEERIRKIDEVTEGFIYAVSTSSTTGAQHGFSEEQELYFKRLKDMKLLNPFLIGFGVSNLETFTAANKFSAGAIVGSAFINLIKDSTDLKFDIVRFVNGLRQI